MSCHKIGILGKNYSVTLGEEIQMGALASCRFPFLDQWKKLADSNPVLGFIDAVLCGFSQIIFSDNSLSGLLLIIASFLVAPKVGIAGLWSAIVSVAFQKIMKTPAIGSRLGVNTFCAVLTGVIMGGLIYNEGISLGFFIFFGMSAIFCTVTNIGLAAIFGKFNAAPLGLPFGLATLVFMAAAQNMGFISQADSVVAHAASQLTPEDIAAWDGASLWQSLYSGVSELVGGANLVVALVVAAALLVSSRIDFLNAVLGSFCGAVIAMYFGVPNLPVVLGLYGYNGALLMFVLNGRAFKITTRSFLMNLIMAGMSAILSAWLSVSFGLVGAVYTAFPFSIICCLLMLAAPSIQGLEYNPPAYWGVPETVPAIKAAAESAEE